MLPSNNFNYPTRFITQYKKNFCPHKILANSQIKSLHYNRWKGGRAMHLFFNFWYHSQMAFTCSQQRKHQFLTYVKYAWKPMYKICWKPTIKAQDQGDWCCSGVFIISFAGAGIQDYAGIRILPWLLDFDLDGLVEDFLPVSWVHLFKYFKN